MVGPFRASGRGGARATAGGSAASPRAAAACIGRDEQARREVGPAQVRAAQVGAEEVGQPQVGAAQVGPEQQRAPQRAPGAGRRPATAPRRDPPGCGRAARRLPFRRQPRSATACRAIPSRRVRLSGRWSRFAGVASGVGRAQAFARPRAAARRPVRGRRRRRGGEIVVDQSATPRPAPDRARARGPRRGTRAARAPAGPPRTPRTSAPATSGARQSRPANARVTRWPAPRQSKTVHPAKPRSRRSAWMPQRKSCCRWVHGVPAGLSMAKSADRANAGATQHSPTHREQSARSSTTRHARRCPTSRGRRVAPRHARGRVSADGSMARADPRSRAPAHPARREAAGPAGVAAGAVRHVRVGPPDLRWQVHRLGVPGTARLPSAGHAGACAQAARTSGVLGTPGLPRRRTAGTRPSQAAPSVWARRGRRGRPG